MKILIVEDEKELLDSIASYLELQGYLCEKASNYKNATSKINDYEYDCFIIDIMLPDGSGIQLIKEIKKLGKEGGIIILSANGSLNNKIEGLESGSDDYLTKPFHLAELNARLKSIVRRKSFSGSDEIIFNEIKILSQSREVSVADKAIILTSKEYDLLLFFIANKGRVISKDSLVEHLWGDDIDQADSFDFIYTHMKNLRKKLLNGGSNDYIKTIYGIGYKFSST